MEARKQGFEEKKTTTKAIEIMMKGTLESINYHDTSNLHR